MNTITNNKTQTVMKRSVRFLIMMFIIGIFSHDVKAQNVVVIGNPSSTTTGNSYPVALYYQSSWCRMLYYGADIGTSTSGGKITKIEFDYVHASPYTFTGQTVYMRAVSSTTLTTGYIDPTLAATGVDLVYTGSFAMSNGWTGVVLDAPFELPPGQNLEIFWWNSQSSYPGSAYHWRRTATTYAATVYAQADAPIPTSAGSAYNEQCNIRITWEPLERTAAVTEVLSPATRFQWDGVSKIPVDVKIANKGTDTITSCDVNWSVNGSSVVTHSNSTLLIQGATPLAMNLDSMISSQITANKRNSFTVYVDNALPFDNNQGDDTVKVDFFPCTYFLNGTYTIGGTTPDFATIGDAIDHLMNCGVEGPVTFNIRTGTYTGDSIFLLGEIPGASAYNTVTFTSASGDADDVTITNTGTTVKLAGVSYVRFQNLTLGGTTSAATQTVVFEESCEDILFHHCKINTYSSGTSTTYCGVYYSPSSGHLYKLTDIRFIGNEITGGYASFYFNYMSGAVGSARGNVTIDSNIMTNFYNSGVYSNQNGYFSSISYNTILPRGTTTHYGLYLINTNTVEKMVSNTIRSNSTSSGYGLYLNSNFNYYSKTGAAGSQAPCEIYNNEIILLGSGTKYGVYLASAKVNMYHNSVYLGGSGTNYGLNIAGVSTAYPINAKNNIFVTTTSSASSFPLYAANATHVTTTLGTTLDYNNYYSTKGLLGTIGGTGTANYVSSLAMLQNATGQDRNSVSIAPHFRDINTSLYLHSIAMQVPELSAVFEDHDGNTRNSMTSMGAFEFVPEQIDLEVVSMVTPTDVVVIGASTPVTARVYNVGLTPVSGFTVALYFNNVLQGTPVTHSGTLNPMEYVDVILPNITPVAGNNVFKIISSLATDTVRVNDTLQVTLPACDSLMHGRYTIGTGGDFATITAALAELNRCGIDGPVELAYLKNTSAGALTITGMVVGANQQNTVTITSNDDDADSVIFTTVTFNEASYWKLKYVTVGSSTATSGNRVTFNTNNTDIEIYGCKILLSPAATSGYGIYHSNSSSVLRDIVISNNLIDGGSYNMYLNYVGYSGNIGSMTIDNNILSNAYQYGIYGSYTYCNFPSISNNIITSRSSGTTTTNWYGIYFNYYNTVERMVDNKIHSTNAAIRYPRGIYLNYYFNTGSSGTMKPALIANNEIILQGCYTSATYTYHCGIYVYQPYNSQPINVYHNSVYLYHTTLTTGYGAGIFPYRTSTSYIINIKNNNIVTSKPSGTSATLYPYYTTSASYEANTYGERDYNNYYNANSTTIAYQGAARTLATLKSANPPQEANTVSVNPGFTTSSTDLMPNVSFANFSPVLTEVEKDIRGLKRASSNNLIGAYALMFDLDAGLDAFITPGSDVIAGQATDIDVRLNNFGYNTLNTVTIHYSIFDGTTTNTYSQTVSGMTLASLRDTVIRLNQPLTALPNTFYTITAWTGSPNGSTDQNIYNDTISTRTYGCVTRLNGTYDIAGGNMDFANIADAMDVLVNCGVEGPVVFRLANGNYPKFRLERIYKGMSAANTLTFTSLSGNAGDVTFSAMDTALVLKNTGHLRFENITIGSSSGMNAICFVEDNDNIAFRLCEIKGNSTTTSTAVTYAAICYNNSASGKKITNILFVNNIIDGGSDNFYINYMGGTSSSGSTSYGSMTIDSNIMTNSYRSGIYMPNYSSFGSVSYNTITNRTSGSYSTWYGIYTSSYTSADKVEGNKIQTKSAISTPYGIMFGSTFNYSNYGTTNYYPLIANNEIILQATGTGYGIYLDNNGSHPQILHNSVYISGSGNGYGFRNGNLSSASYQPVLKNNSFVLSLPNAGACPIWFPTAIQVTYMQQDYNNYYNTNRSNIANIGGSILTSLSALQIASNQDANSMSVMPNFNDVTIDLSTDGMEMWTDRISPVMTDIRDTARLILTNMGAYHDFKPEATDVKAVSFVLSTGSLEVGNTSDILFTLQNTGLNNLDSVEICVEVDGTLVNCITWRGSLAMGRYARNLNIGSYTPVVRKMHEFVIYTRNPNGVQDDVTANDTIIASEYACDGPLINTVTVGDIASDFQTMDELFTALSTCGISGTVTVEVAKGVYSSLNFYPDAVKMTAADNLIFTSATGNADDVRFIAVGDAALTLNAVRNITFRNLTFDATGGTHGVQFINACTNIVVTYCDILAMPLSTSTNNCGIFRTSGGGVMMDIVLSNNTISGGYANMYLRYLGSSSTGANRGTIRIDSNTMSDAYHSGLYFYYIYADAPSISHNTITKNPTSTGTFYGMYINYSYLTVDTMASNKIHLINSSTGGLYGMYIYYAYLNNYNRAGSSGAAVPAAIIKNNEIILKTGASTCYGVYAYYYGDYKFLHNSIYIENATTVYGLYRYTTSTAYLGEFKYNNIYINSTGTAYMFYGYSATYFTTAYGEVDYNNYYRTGTGTTTYYGYTTYTTLPAWQTSGYNQDVNSTENLPMFENLPHTLMLADSVGMSSPRINAVLADIDDKPRNAYTSKGAYDGVPYPYDVRPVALTIDHGVTTVSAGVNVRLDLEIKNKGSNSIDSVLIAIEGTQNTIAPKWYYFTPAIALHGTRTFRIDSALFDDGINNLKIYTNLPNGNQDDYPKDDTLNIEIYGCTAPLAGDYTIGGGGDYDNVEAAVKAINACGVSAPVRFIIATGTYPAALLVEQVPGASSTNTITFMSASGDADDVLIGPSSGTTLTLTNAAHLKFHNVTLGNTLGTTYGVHIVENANNIEFYGCNINSSVTATGTANVPVYYYNTSGHSYRAENIRFVKNVLTGGYASFYFYYPSGSQTLARSTFTIDSNELKEFYYHGIYSYYNGYYYSISNNVITSRENVTSAQYGMYLYYYNTVEKLANNKIKLNTTSGTAYGMYLYYYFNHYTSSGTTGMFPSEVNNNEVIIPITTGTNYGIHLYYSKVNLYHNSVYLGGTGTHYGLYFNPMSTTYPAVVKNNNFVTTTSNTANYPIYTATATYATQAGGVTLDYNNYYGTGDYVGYIGSPMATLPALQQATGQDINSMNREPVFDNPMVSLRFYGMNLAVPRLTGVLRDIADTVRESTTMAGAYEFVPVKDYDIAPEMLINPAPVVFASPEKLTVSLRNMGIIPVTTAQVSWTLNGGAVNNTPFTGNLLSRRATNIDLSSNIFASLQSWENQLEIITSLPNGQADEVPENDTLRATVFKCDSALNGRYVIGSGGDFEDLDEVIKIITNCGISGPVELAFLTGTYSGLSISGLVNGSSAVNTVTITSVAENADSVKFVSIGTPALTLSASDNWIFKHVTFDARGGTHGIHFMGACTNIVVIYCDIFAMPLSTSTNNCGIYRTSGGGVMMDVVLSNNTISGGYANMYLTYLGSGSTGANRGTIRIDSNTMSDAYHSGLYFYYIYADAPSISYNTITKNPGSTATFYGMYIYYSYLTVDTMASNKIHLINSSTGGLYGMYIYYAYLNNYDRAGLSGAAVSPAIIKNNEIILKSGASTCYGVYAYYYGDYKFLHNSIYIENATTVYGLYRYTTSTAYLGEFKYNNIHINSTGTAYMFYGYNTTYFTTAYGEVDYNNYYRTGTGTTTYYGYTTYTTLSAWQTSGYNQDVNSIISDPGFIGTPPSDLNTENVSLLAPVNEVRKDIREVKRFAPNNLRGAYAKMFDVDAGLDNFVAPSEISLANQPNDIKVKLVNYGKLMLTSVDIYWTVDGQPTPPNSISLTGLSLASLQDTVIDLSTFIPNVNTFHTITAWTSNPNNSTDQLPNNDTISMQTYGCLEILNGVYDVGGGAMDFATIADAITVLENCGVSGPVTFRLATGTYPSLTLNRVYRGTNANNTVTFTSIANHADSVVIGTSSMAALTLTETKHLRFTKITFGNTANTTYGVHFIGNGDDIEFYECNINSNLSGNTNAYSCVYYNNASGHGYKLYAKFIKNTLTGGYSSFYLYYPGGSGSSKGLITIDSNKMIDFNYYGIYAYYYSAHPSISYNTLISSNTTFAQCGMYFFAYCTIDEMIGNRIYIQGTGGTSYGIQFNQYINNYNLTSTTSGTPCKMYNNEIIMPNGAGIKQGIHLYYSKVDGYHNSVYLSGTGTNYGLFFNPMSTGYPSTFKNNIFSTYTTAVANYPIYTTTATYATQAGGVTLDYNNYYGSGAYVGYIVTNLTTLAALQAATGQDANSMNAAPSYVNPLVDLHIGPKELIVPRLPQVLEDINKTERYPYSSVGCYEDYVMDENDIMPALVDYEPDPIEAKTGTFADVYVTIRNVGSETVDSANIYWKRSTAPTYNMYKWYGNLESFEEDRVKVGTFSPVLAGYNCVNVYTSMPNGVQDEYIHNDTIYSYCEYACDSALNGIYNVAGGVPIHFATIDDAMTKLSYCGVSGPVTFVLHTGTYPSLNLISGVFNGTSETNTVTFTSSTGDASDVTIGSNTGTALKLSGAKHLRFLNITIGNTANTTYGVDMDYSLENIEFRGCNINSVPTATSTAYAAVYCTNNGKASRVNNIKFVNNNINGGYYNFYLHYPNSSSGAGNMGSITIDSNVLTNSYYYGIYAYYYGYYPSISYNTITSRNSNSSSTWYGMYFYYYNSVEKIEGNRIKSINSSITTPYGIYIYYYFNYGASYGTSNTAPLIANNEIILRSNGIGYGFYAYQAYSNYQFYHNSIYMYGTGAARGIYLYNTNTTYKARMQHNNVITAAAAGAHPIFYNGNYYSNDYNGASDYNNYYSTGTYIGQANGTNLNTLADLQAFTLRETNSQSMMPSFISPTDSLRVGEMELNVDPMPEVAKDINAEERFIITNMGCYQDFIVVDNDAMPVNAYFGHKLEPGVPADVYVSIRTLGREPLDSVEIYFRTNNGAYSSYKWHGHLELGEYENDIYVGQLIPESGYNCLTVYTAMPNGEPDGKPYNDTLRPTKCSYACDTAWHGVHVVGSGGTFVDAEEAAFLLSECGIDGPVTLRFLRGTYGSLHFNTEIEGMSSVNTVTVTSATGKTKDVTFKPVATDAVYINNMSHFIFKNVTMDASSGNSALRLDGTCGHIEVEQCSLVARSGSSASADYMSAIYSTSSENLSGMRIVNNTIKGGYHNIYFTSTGSLSYISAAEESYIDSNIFSEPYYSNIYINNANMNIASMNDNQISMSTVSTASSPASYGIYLNSYVNVGEITRNRIRASLVGNYPYYGYGIGLYSMNDDSKGNTYGTLQIVQNEIMLNGYNAIYGVYVSATPIDLLQNSIYVTNTYTTASTANMPYGLYLNNTSSTNYSTIKNNDIYVKSGSRNYGVPVQFSNLTYASATYCELDNNNYYNAGTTNKYLVNTYTTLASWQGAYSQDANSMNVLAPYDILPTDMSLYDSASVTCPRLSGIIEDINGKRREAVTTVGAYDGVPFPYDLSPISAVINNGTTPVGANSPVYMTVDVKNKGAFDVDSMKIYIEVNGVVQGLPHAWRSTRPIKMREVREISLANTFFTAGINSLKIFTDSPNGHPDEYPKDDTLKLEVLACGVGFAGTYTIGGPGANFENVEKAVEALSICGVVGPVEMIINDGDYPESIIIEAITGTSATNTITFVSASGNAADVSIGTDVGVALSLVGARHLVFKNITIGVTSGETTHGVDMSGTITNVEFYGCNINSSLTATTAVANVVNYANTGSTRLNNVRLVKNTMTGGYASVYYTYPSGGSAVSGNQMAELRIDSNTMTDAYQSGIFMYYNAYSHSISYNNITLRNSSEIQYGILLDGAYHTVDSMLGNKVHLLTTGTAHGILIFNYLNDTLSNRRASGSAYIVNNEVMKMSGTGSAYGIESYNYNNADIIHNSVYVTNEGSTGEAMAFLLHGNMNADYSLVVTNNNFVTSSDRGYPIYVADVNNVLPGNGTTLDYNNYHNTVKQSAGYINTTPYATLLGLQGATRQDVNSISKAPIFTNIPNGLNIGGTDLLCPVVFNPVVNRDIDNKSRTIGSFTSMGAYHMISINDLDITPYRMAGLVNPIDGTIAHRLDVEIMNVGSSLVNRATITYYMNGAPVGTLPNQAISPAIAPYQSSIVTLNPGYSTWNLGVNKLRVVTSLPNGIPDEDVTNDTLDYDIFACRGPLNGPYLVGSGDFVTIEDAMNALKYCGVSGPVEFRLLAGNYDAVYWSNVVIPGISSVNTVTFISDDEDPDMVVIGNDADNAITLQAAEYLRFVKLTFGNTTATKYGVSFVESSNNVEFYACKINAADTAKGATHAPVYFGNLSGSTYKLTDVKFVKNILTGGHSSFLLLNPGGTTYSRSSITIDSNEMNLAYMAGIYSYCNGYYPSISHNKISTRLANTEQVGIYMYSDNSVERMEGNSIKINGTDVGYGILAAYMNHYTLDGNTGQAPSKIYNNEIIKTTSGTNYGIFTNFVKADMHHNTVYLAGNSDNYGWHNEASNSIYKMNVKNNMFVTATYATSSSFPVNIPTAANATQANGVSLDYNNYYSTGDNLARIGGNPITTLAALQAVTGQDANSISEDPAFVLPTDNLEPSDWDVLSCSQITDVKKDIKGEDRQVVTYVGAYTKTYDLDAALLEFVTPAANITAGQAEPIKVRLANVGHTTINQVRIAYSVDGAPTISNTFNNLNLATSQDTVLQLGTITLANGDCSDIVAWCYNPNSLTDQNTSNDTISTNTCGCTQVLNGVYTVGTELPGRDFANLVDALAALNACGVSGPVTFLLDSTERYVASALGGMYQGMSSVNTVTFKSARKAFPAGFYAQGGGTALTLQDMSHFKFEDMVFTANYNNGMHGIELDGDCENLEFYGCTIVAPSYSSTVLNANGITPSGIYEDGIGTLNDIRILKNYISGGYSNIRITNGISMGDNNIIDSNELIDGCISPMWISGAYMNFNSISHNIIRKSTTFDAYIPTAAATYYSYGAIFSGNVNIDKLIGNKILDSNATPARMWAIGFEAGVNYYNNPYGKIKVHNNEIIVKDGSAERWGIAHLGYTNAEFLHNSIYMASQTAGRGFYTQDQYGTSIFKYNIIDAQEAIYGIYVAATNLPLFTSDYNNYNSNQGLVAIRTITNQDANSVAEAPDYIDVNVDLDLGSAAGIIMERDDAVMTDIKGTARTEYTTMGAYSIIIYNGRDLTISELLEPINTDEVNCYPDSTPVRVLISNIATETIDFEQTPMTIYLKVTGPENFMDSVVITSGIMKSAARQIFEITDRMPVKRKGIYHITTWISNVDDRQFNDTLRYDYEMKRFVLPFATNFDTLPAEFSFQQLAGVTGWTHTTGIGWNPTVNSVYGTGRLQFANQSGSVAKAVLTPISLAGSINPVLKFWYGHDINNPNGRDYMTVQVSIDGGATFIDKKVVRRYNASVSTTGIVSWVEYQVDLSEYDDQTCVIIALLAGSAGGGHQSIDSLCVVSDMDAALSMSIFTQEDLVACDFSGKEVSLTLSNLTPLPINFEYYSSEIVLEIEGPLGVTPLYMQSLTPIGLFAGDSSITYRATTNLSFPGNGTYTVRAYLKSFDMNPYNDTVSATFVINTGLVLTQLDTLPIKNYGDIVFPTVHIKNTGNLPIQNIPVRYTVDNGNVADRTEIIPGTLAVGDSITYTFNQAFNVPAGNQIQPYYKLSAQLLLPCIALKDPLNVFGAIHYAEFVDLEIVAINDPISTKCDTGKTLKYVDVTIANHGNKFSKNTPIYITIDSAGVELKQITDVIPAILSGETIQYLASIPYDVPNFAGNYTVTVYVEDTLDVDISNNTYILTACAIEKPNTGIDDIIEDGNDWGLGQNRPNPASNTTLIPYSIPEDGTVIFSITNVSGQILYNRRIDAYSGENYLEIDVNHLSSGIYYYSMEYEGRRFVKKMVIQR